MFDKKLNPYRKRLNTQIVAKAEIAFGALKRYEIEQSRISFNRPIRFNQKNMINELDSDYSKLVPHKKIELDQVYSISLFTYSQQFYCLQMVNYVFPMRVLFRNVKNDGVVYIGYDQQYPGIEKHNKLSIFENQLGQNQRNYDFKEIINKDMLITLKNKGNSIVQNIYFTISAGSSLLMFDFKVQFLGLINNRKERVVSQQKFKNLTKVNLGNGWQRSQLLVRQKTQQLIPYKQSKLPEISKVNNETLIKLQEFQVFKEQMPKHFSKQSLTPSKQLSSRRKDMVQTPTLLQNKKSGSQSLFQQPRVLTGAKTSKGEIDLKIEQTKRNKQVYQIFKQKDKQLRQIAGKFKRLIQNYKKIYNQECVRKKKINKDLVISIYSILYINQIHKTCQKTIKKQNMKFKVVYLCKKFIKKLKRKYQQTCKIQPYRYKRLINQSIDGLQIQSKILYKNSILLASKNIMDIFLHLRSVLSINKSMNLANSYRDRVIFIQKQWKSKHHNRLVSLLYFVDRHVQKMTRQHENLKPFVEQFFKREVNRSICLQYIKDESQKFRFIYDAYLRKLEEIDQIVYINYKKAMQKSMSKSMLLVPKKPIKPMHRFYRNCDILKSMVRNWFQIQFKKHSKKNSQKSFK